MNSLLAVCETAQDSNPLDTIAICVVLVVLIVAVAWVRVSRVRAGK